MLKTFACRIDKYMFFHPDNIVNNYPEGPFRRWQHAMLASDVFLTATFDHSKVTQIMVTQCEKVLERVDIVFEAQNEGSLCIVSFHNWISVKKRALNSDSEFRVRFRNKEDCDYIMKSLSWIRTSMDPHKTISSHCGDSWGIQNEQFSQKAPQPHFTEMNLRLNHLNAHMRPRSTNTQPLNIMSNESQTNSVVMSVAGYESLHSDDMDVVNLTQRQITGLNIIKLIKQRKGLSLVANGYSFGEIKMSRVRLQHLGHVSDLCLSLVPFDHNGNPVVLLTRGIQTLETITPHPGHIRVRYSLELLVLELYNQGLGNKNRLAVIRMKHANIIAVCRWFMEFMVSVESIRGPAMATDTTCDVAAISSSRAVLSESSNMSRETRYWSRRVRRSR